MIPEVSLSGSERASLIGDLTWADVLGACHVVFKVRLSGIYEASCPFHTGRTSMNCWPGSKRWRCHRCGLSGDIVDFLVAWSNKKLHIKELEALIASIHEHKNNGHH